MYFWHLKRAYRNTYEVKCEDLTGNLQFIVNGLSEKNIELESKGFYKKKIQVVWRK